MNKVKKLSSLLLTVIMVLSLVTVPGKAVQADGPGWEVNPNYESYVYAEYQGSYTLEAPINYTDGSVSSSDLTFQWCEGSGWDEEVEIISENASLELNNLTSRKEYCCHIEDSTGNRSDVPFEIVINTGLTSNAEDAILYRYVPSGEGTTLEVNPTTEVEVDIFYKWEKCDVPGDEESFWSTITGETGNTLELAAVTTKEEYRCRISDACGNVVYVMFVVNLDSGMNVGEEDRWLDASLGEDVTLTVGATANDGEALSYEWKKIAKLYDEDGDYYYEDYVTIEGAVTDSYVYENITNNQNIRCDVSDSYGCKKTVLFHFNYDKGWNLENTYSQEFLSIGGNTTLSVNVVNDNNIPLTYQWYTEWNDNGRELIPQATGSSYEVNNVDKNKNYICVVADAYGNEEEYQCEISIDTGLSFASEGNTILRIPYGNSVTISANAVANEGVEISYQWKSYESVYDEYWGDYYETYVDIEGRQTAPIRYQR